MQPNSKQCERIFLGHILFHNTTIAGTESNQLTRVESTAYTTTTLPNCVLATVPCLKLSGNEGY